MGQINEFTQQANLLGANYINIYTNNQSTFKNLMQQSLVNDRKSFYKNQNFTILDGWNTFAEYAYILLGVLVAVYLLLSASLTWKTKLGGLALIVVMYFTMQYFVSLFILLAYQIYNILPTNVYTSL